MSWEEENSEKILAAYLKGTLPSAQRERVAERLREDAELPQELKQTQATLGLLREAQLAELRMQIRADLRQQTSGKWRNGALGAGLLVLGALLAWWLLPGQLATNPNSELLPQQIEKKSSTAPMPSAAAPDVPTSTLLPSKKASARTQMQTAQEPMAAAPAPVATHESTKSDAVSTPTDAMPEATKPATAASPCANFDPKFTWASQPSHQGMADGQISIATKQNELLFGLDGAEPSRKKVFEHLEAGQHVLHVASEQGCSTTPVHIGVGSTLCPSETAQTYSLASGTPYVPMGILPEAEHVAIFDKQMRPIAERNSHSLGWDGTDSHGRIVSTGLYKVEIRYSNQERCFVSLTIFE